MSALSKYLSPDNAWTEPESHCLKDFPGTYQRSLVVPIYRESPQVLPRFCRFAEANPGTLLLLIINRPDTDPDNSWASPFFEGLLLGHSSTSEPPLSGHSQLTEPIWQSNNQLLTLHTLTNGSALLRVDRCLKGPPIPADQGVGLARKIAADILCQLINDRKVISPWIANTDADALLPADYFTAIEQSTPAISKTETAAIVYPYQHVASEDTPILPTLLYEFSLHYYVEGLRWAGSPYSYHTLGSTIAVNYRHYAGVRGFPKRAGAEDFYLLNKLAKTGQIYSLAQPTILLQTRESTRVPFGTGPAVINLAKQNNPFAMPLYHPDSFLYLRFFLQLCTELTRKPMAIDDCAQQLKISTSAPIELPLILGFAEQHKLNKALTHSFKQGKDQRTRQQHLQAWFDGFKTLKLIHYLRDSGDDRLMPISFQQWLQQTPDTPATGEHPTKNQPTAQRFASTPTLKKLTEHILEQQQP